MICFRKDHDAQTQRSPSLTGHRLSLSYSHPYAQPIVHSRSRSHDFVDSTLLAELSFDDANTPWQEFGTDDDSEVAPGDGILVRAIFSYEGQEDDELTFSKGSCGVSIECS